MSDQEYYDKVSELVKAADFDTLIADKEVGFTPEDSAQQFITEYNEQ